MPQRSVAGRVGWTEVATICSSLRSGSSYNIRAFPVQEGRVATAHIGAGGPALGAIIVFLVSKDVAGWLVDVGDGVGGAGDGLQEPVTVWFVDVVEAVVDVAQSLNI